MPVTITRTGELVTPLPVLTPEQKNKLWENVVRNWAKAHPEAFQNEEPSDTEQENE